MNTELRKPFGHARAGLFFFGLFGGCCALTALVAGGCLSASGPTVAAKPFPATLDPAVAWTNALVQLSAVTPEQYPDADRVSVYEWESTAYSTNGTYVTEIVDLTKVLTQRGLDGSRVVSFWNNDFYGTFEVLAARVHSADGTVRDIPLEGNLSEAIDTDQLSSNIHNADNKNISLSIPGLELGDAVELRLRRNILKARVPGTFSDYITFEESNPVLWKGVEFRQPATLPLRARALRSAEVLTLSHTAETNAAGQVIERWIAADTPRYFSEPMMPDAYSCTARLLVSTVDSWETLSRWYARLCAPRLEAVNEPMRAKVAELTGREGMTRDEKIRALFDFVSREVRYMGTMAENEAPGYEPHDVSLTFDERNGVCRDKAALLVAMFRLAGIDAWPVLIHVGPRKDVSVPQPFFNHAIVAADSGNPEDPYLLMDPTSETTRSLLPEYLCEKSYLVAQLEGDHLRETPAIPAEKNLLVGETAYTLLENGSARGETTLRFLGVHDAIYRQFFASNPEATIQRMLQERLDRALPGAALTAWTLTPESGELRARPDPMTLVLRYEAPAPAPVAATADSAGSALPPPRFLEPPCLAGSMAFASRLLSRLGLEKRRFPFETEITTGFRETITLNLPEGVTLLDREDIRCESEGVVFSDTLARDEASGKPVRTRELLLTASQYSAEEYQGLRRVREAEERSGRAVELLAMPAAAAPAAAPAPSAEDLLARAVKPLATEDIYTEKVAAVIRFDEAATNGVSWTVRRENTLKILTYPGQQKAADLTVTFIPPGEDVTPESAFVITAEGERKPVDLSLNWFEADAEWNDSAPRYPAGKLCTLSFPNVTPGATISYTLVSRYTEQPFFYFSHLLGSPDSFGELSVTVVGTNEWAQSFTLFDPPYETAALRHAVTVTNTVSEAGEPQRTWLVRGGGPDSALAADFANMPPSRRLFPVLRGGTCRAEDLARAYAAKMRACSDPAEQVLAASLARSLATPDAPVPEKIRAIRNWTAENLRADGPDFGSLPVDFLSPADETLDARYGHDGDLIILSLAMARTLGLEPSIRFYAGRWDANPVPGDAPVDPAFFDDVALAVRDPASGTMYFLDGASQYAPLTLNANAFRPYAEVQPDAPETVVRHAPDGLVDRFPEEGATWEHCTHEVFLEPSGSARIAVTVRYGGESAESFRRRWTRMVPEERNRAEQTLVKSIAQSARLVGTVDAQFAADKPCQITLTAEVPDYAESIGAHLAVRLPGNPLALSPVSSARRFPFRRVSAVRMRADWVIHAPTGFVAVATPRPHAFGTDAATPDAMPPYGATYTRTVADDADGTLRICNDLRLLPGEFPAEQYPAFLEQCLGTRGVEADTILFAPVAP